MHLEFFTADSMTLLELLLDVRFARCGHQRRDHVFVRYDVVEHCARLDDTGPADSSWNSKSTFPVRVLLSAERCRAAVGPGEHFGTVVGGIHDNRILIESKLREFVEQLTDMPVVFHHSVGINAKARFPFAFLL